MKKQDIRIAYTKKVTELLNQGYTIFPDTMNGTQGEIAHIDLTNGSEILRVLLTRQLSNWRENEFTGNLVVLTVGRAEPELSHRGCWNGTIWNNKLEPLFQSKWAEIRDDGDGWYTDLDEANRIEEIRRERHHSETAYKELGDAFKPPVLDWLRKQPGMKTCKLKDITKVVRVNKQHYGELLPNLKCYEVTARGKTFQLRPNKK